MYEGIQLCTPIRRHFHWTDLSGFQSDGQAIVHHRLQVLVVILSVLLLTLRVDLLNGLLARQLATNRDVASIDDQVLALRRCDTCRYIK